MNLQDINKLQAENKRLRDIVEDMREALEKTAELVEILGQPAAKAKAALAKLEGV